MTGEKCFQGEVPEWLSSSSAKVTARSKLQLQCPSSASYSHFPPYLLCWFTNNSQLPFGRLSTGCQGVIESRWCVEPFLQWLPLFQTTPWQIRELWVKGSHPERMEHRHTRSCSRRVNTTARDHLLNIWCVNPQWQGGLSARLHMLSNTRLILTF